MARPKRAPALYEVLRKSKNPPPGIGGPASPETPPEAADERPAESPPPTLPPPPAAPREPVVVEERPGFGDETGRMPPTATTPLAMNGIVIRFALTSTWAAVVLFALVAVLTLAFVFGQHTGYRAGKAAGWNGAQEKFDREGVDETERIRRGPPRTGLFEGIGGSPVAADTDETDAVAPTAPAKPEKTATPPPPPPKAREATAPGKATWVSGLTYIVVQDFHQDARDDALGAQGYLRQHGIETSLDEASGTWRYQLITHKGFNREDRAQTLEADQFLNRLRQIGAAYYKAGGRYKLEGYFKKRTDDHW